jgi:hypothetical protein
VVLPDPERSRVVLIGASRFTDPELPDLPAVRNNLDGLAACLRGTGRCTVVADPDSPVALMDPVHDAAQQAEDTLIIYYAGHGFVHPRTLELLLATVGSNPVRTHTTAPYDHVRYCLVDSPAPRKVVILDCCYSGRIMGGMTDPAAAVANEAAVEGTYLLASAPPNKQALSPPGERYTAFTGALLGVLTEGLPDGPEHLPLDLIYRQVRDTLRRAGRPEPQLRMDNTAGELALICNPAYAIPGIRDRIKELVRGVGITHSFACPICYATVTGEKLLRHVDKHSQADKEALDRDTMTLTVRSDLLGNQYVLGNRFRGSDHLFHAIDTATKDAVLISDRPSEIRPGLVHPVIVPILEVMNSHTVLGNVAGRTATDLLRSHGPLPPETAVRITADICATLDYLHRRGVDHGDIRASNVLITEDGARLITIWYGGPVNPQADLHDTGRLLIELVTGQSGSLYLVGTGLGWGPELQIPPALDTVMRTAITTGYPSAAAMREALLNAI